MHRVGVAAIYTRGLNPPYTEGHIAVARSMARAIALEGWTPFVLNFRYSTRSHVAHRLVNSGVCPTIHFEMRIPCIERESLHCRKIGAKLIFASALELTMLPILIAQEVRAKTSIVHLVNCFKLPRALLRLIRGIPVISHIYQTPVSTRPDLPLPVDAFVASSQRVARTLEALYSKRFPVFTVPPAVDTYFFRTEGDLGMRRKTGLYVGNLSYSRFPNELLEIFRKVIKVDPDISFRVIAPVNDTNIVRAHEISTICRSLQIEDKVIVSVHDMNENEKMKEYIAAKSFIFPPIRECNEAIEPPLTVLEALASGLPVLATDTYSVSEAAIPGKSGFLVSVENYADLADKAVSIFQADETRWREWSAEARRIAIDNFSISSASRKLANVHSTILENQNL